MYNEIRKKYIKKYYWGSPNMIKLTELMITVNENMLLNLAMYTERAFKIRSDLYTNLYTRQKKKKKKKKKCIQYVCKTITS